MTWMVLGQMLELVIIQDEMQYPGQVKVTVIREKRAITYAR